MASNQTSIAQRSQAKLYFDHKDMDYYLSWIMGCQIYGGSEAGECLAAAAQVVDGDAQSWQSAWRSLAERVEAQAQVAPAAWAQAWVEGHAMPLEQAVAYALEGTLGD